MSTEKIKKPSREEFKNLSREEKDKLIEQLIKAERAKMTPWERFTLKCRSLSVSGVGWVVVHLINFICHYSVGKKWQKQADKLVTKIFLWYATNFGGRPKD